GLLCESMSRPVAVVSANDCVIDQVADNLGAPGGRMRVITAHKLGPGVAPPGDSAIAAHSGVCIKECAAGLGRYGALVAYQARDRRSGEDAAAFTPRAAVHRRDQHYGSMRKGRPNSSDDLYCVPMVLVHRQTLELAFIRAVVEYHQIGIAMGDLFGPMFAVHVICEQTDKSSIYSQRVVLDAARTRFEYNSEQPDLSVTGGADGQGMRSPWSLHPSEAGPGDVHGSRHAAHRAAIDCYVEVAAARLRQVIDVER